MKEYTFNPPHHLVEIQTTEPGISIAVAQFADQLINRFTAVCDQPFNLDISEAVQGEADHLFVTIGTTDAAGKLIIDPINSREDLTYAGGQQSYIVRYFDGLGQDQFGVVTINVFMQCLSTNGSETRSSENPIVHTLLDLAFMRYYETAEQIDSHQRREYIKVPTHANSIIPAPVIIPVSA